MKLFLMPQYCYFAIRSDSNTTVKNIDHLQIPNPLIKGLL